MPSIDTTVEADPGSCRESAKQIRDLRKAADGVETKTKPIAATFAGATASGQIAQGLSSACTVLSGRGRALSDDLDTADRALTTFATSIDTVVTDMARARSHALDHQLVVADQTSIVLPADPKPEQVSAYNECVTAVNKVRQDEFRATRALQQVMNTLAPHEEPLPKAPTDTPPAETPAPPTPPPTSGGPSASDGGGTGDGTGDGTGSPSSPSGRDPQITVDHGTGVTTGTTHPNGDASFSFTPVAGVAGPHGEPVYYGPTAQDAQGHEHGPQGHPFLVGSVDPDGDGPKDAGGKPQHFVALPGVHGPHGEQLYVLDQAGQGAQDAAPVAQGFENGGRPVVDGAQGQQAPGETGSPVEADGGDDGGDHGQHDDRGDDEVARARESVAARLGRA